MRFHHPKIKTSLSSSNNKMSSTTTERSLPPPHAGRRRRGGSDRTGNRRAAMTAARAKRTRRLSRTRWESCPKTESPRRDRTPRAPPWRSAEVRVRTSFRFCLSLASWGMLKLKLWDDSSPECHFSWTVTKLGDECFSTGGACQFNCIDHEVATADWCMFCSDNHTCCTHPDSHLPNSIFTSSWVSKPEMKWRVLFRKELRTTSHHHYW